VLGHCGQCRSPANLASSAVIGPPPNVAADEADGRASRSLWPSPLNTRTFSHPDTMTLFVPSQICEFLDNRVPAAIAQSKGGGAFNLGPDHAGMLAHLLTMIDGVPPHLLTLDASAAAELCESVEAIRMALAAWRVGGHNIALNPLVGKNSWNPLTFIRRHFGALPDEGAAAELFDLEFITDETLPRSLATDLHSINAALDRGAWKSATLLAGSLAEAFCQRRCSRRRVRSTAASTTARTRRRQPARARA
jgi:hypothetical protein